MGKFLVALKHLEKWFQKQQRVLPWRNQPSVYRVWISEIMLQQTQVVTVIPYFEKFMNRFPTLKDLATAESDEVLKYWAGLGYYSRARNLYRASQLIDKKGRFPQTREEWLEIPGVGNYTAGAILSIAFDQPEALLDGNVERVLSRVRRCSRQRGDVLFKSRLWRLSSIFVKTAEKHRIRPSLLNQALMELGATVCTPKKPRCEVCPLQGLCRAYEQGDAEAFPPKKKPKKWTEVQEVLHCIVHSTSGKILLEKRKEGEWRAGLWDLLKSDPRQLYPSSQIEYLGQVKTKHIVTQHHVHRTTEVWKFSAQSKVESKILKAAEKDPSHQRWVSIENPEVAVGSALKKSLTHCAAFFN